MRLFYAAYLSRENMDAYQALIESLIQEVPGVLRSIPPRTHHLTLAFLGEVGEAEVEKCSAALKAVGEFEAFGYSLGRPTILMGRGRPRLIRASVTEGVRQISTLQANLISCLSKDIISIDTRIKPPHITLARFRKSGQRSHARQIEAALDRLSSTGMPEGDQISKVELVKSSLTPSGPSYETLHRIQLTVKN